MSHPRKDRETAGTSAFSHGLLASMVAGPAALLALRAVKGKASDHRKLLALAKGKHKLNFTHVPSTPEASRYAPKAMTGHAADEVYSSLKHSPAITAHELGHARHMGRMSKPHLLAHLVGGRMVLPTAGIATGIGVANSKDEKKRSYAKYLPLAGAAPLLYQEGRATAHAFQDLHKTMRGRGLKHGLTLLPAFASYLAMPAGAAYGLHKYVKNKEKSESNRSK